MLSDRSWISSMVRGRCTRNLLRGLLEFLLLLRIRGTIRFRPGKERLLFERIALFWGTIVPTINNCPVRECTSAWLSTFMAEISTDGSSSMTTYSSFGEISTLRILSSGNPRVSASCSCVACIWNEDGGSAGKSINMVPSLALISTVNWPEYRVWKTILPVNGSARIFW
jgi:hypothetical protein